MNLINNQMTQERILLLFNIHVIQSHGLKIMTQFGRGSLVHIDRLMFDN